MVENEFPKSTEQNEDDGVTTQEHLADEAILVDTLAFTALGLLCPHFLDVLQHHVAVAIERLHASEQATVATAGDQDLGVCASGGLEEGEGASCELMFLDEGDLVFSKLTLGLVKQVLDLWVGRHVGGI